MTVAYGLLILLALLGLAPFVAELTRRPLTPGRLQTSPGEIAHLPKGPTHYRWTGPSEGPVFVCVHGLSTPSYIFAATERSLAAQGYRVLSYDLYGRGFSARPSGDQTAGFFMDQLRDLLKHQEVAEQISLLGFSMGGQIAAAFAAADDRVQALVLVAPSGLAPTGTTGQSSVWTMPWVGGWVTRVFGGIALRRELVEHRSLATVIPNLEDLQAGETTERGFLPALLSSRRHLLGKSATDDHRRVFEAGIPVLAIWGSDDPVVPLTAMATLARVNPDAQHVQIAGAGHNVLQTHPREVARALQEFLPGPH